MVSNLLSILNALQAIAVIITLAMVAWQTIIFVRQTKLNTIINYHQYYKDVNIALLQNPELAASLLGESPQLEMAHIILGLLALSYRLHQDHLTDRSWWKADEATITHVMQQETMRRHWEQNKHTYKQEFVQYIERKLRELDREKQLPSNAKNHP
jgi:hypothetical protein